MFRQLILSALIIPVSRVYGFTIYERNELDNALGETCISSLAANIDCIDYVRAFMQLKYHSSLESVQLTDAVCTATCASSLKNYFDSVSGSCTGKSLSGAPPTKFGGYIWAGYNETCVRDPRTKSYCNDIISNFTVVDDITQMPRTELCHTCHVRRLAMMQSSQYSTYDEFWKSQLEYIYAQCGGNGPTTLPPPLEQPQPEPAPYCLTGKRYTTKAGDTCESIANSTSVSAAALYMGNQAILKDCSLVDPGINVCLPATCQTYYVRPDDTCVSIERGLGLDYGQVREYNSWIKLDCSNLQGATNYYGKIICVSPQGGTWSGTIPAPAPTSNPTLPDGYSNFATPPPSGATVADGTTLNCGKWHVVVAGDSCSGICLQGGITAGLFHLVNPSTTSDNCDSSLKAGSALCVGPTYMWNTTVPITTTMGGSALGMSTANSTSI
ncbi:carbohydrate-binding module family 50 protein [Aaosphaeria arxii CBS 175.79]|uniref:Carbohydrate-binding module family 50 protein n=1 Tax=Aaosphaeria arxii CBS 175.79 TaxID=1450172 RepID=A0A6A5XJC1_9PLEO|nr:carbohydrate-binding module family 50 protein [Aaosphaeria arxii CBS 175.79]KAF2012850.1 carbohydrate-binding module family 50 protein [Aaosphaeria arxii CBS 175.79]